MQPNANAANARKHFDLARTIGAGWGRRVVPIRWVVGHSKLLASAVTTT